VNESLASKEITVGLLPVAEEALDDLRAATGHNSADVVNQALQLYAALQHHRALGSEVLIRSRVGNVSVMTWQPKGGAA
jgi:hypothetical protein